jgi:hypothetical protein
MPLIAQRLGRLIVLSALGIIAACAYTGPTGPEITDALAAGTDHVAGRWSGGTSNGSLTLEFSLTEAADGRVQGTGSMREAQAAAVPIIASGTYKRPNLSLTFTGMVYQGREVVGVFEGPYGSIAGVTGTLRLTGEGFAESFLVTLKEE